jgi:hypothetical protein
LAIFQSPRGQKLSLFGILHEISYDLFFFGLLFRVLEGVKVEKVYSIGNFDKNTKNGLKSSFLSFIFRETAQNEVNLNELWVPAILQSESPD